jgi:DNA-binding CsgD family transcriptional regulator
VRQLTQPAPIEIDPGSTPGWVGANAEKVIAARGDRQRLKRVFDTSLVPMMIVDGSRRYIEVNPPARLAFRLSLAELRRLRIDNLTPAHQIRALDEAWSRLLRTGCVAGQSEVALPDGGRFEVVYCALAGALPGLHLIAFAPAGWAEAELLGEVEEGAFDGAPALTPREIEVLQLSAEGHNAPMIAQELVVSVATVRTHFGNIYEKLGVGERAAAVAKAMRLGLIA